MGVKRASVLFSALLLLASVGPVLADSSAAPVPSASDGSSALPSSVAPLPPVAGQDPRFGIVQAFENPTLAANAGARWERVPFFWEDAQPNGPTDWMPGQFKISDAQLAQELANGMQVVGQIGNPPAWAVNQGSVPQNLHLPWNDPTNYWGQFVYKLAQTYAGRVDTWIIWNEPDFPLGDALSTWAGSAEDYYYLLKDADLAIKAANPKATVVFAGTTYWADVNAGRTLFFQRTLEAAMKDDAANAKANGFYFDAVDIHLYSSPLDLYRVPQVYKQIMTNFGISKPIWISETNVLPYDDPGNETPPGAFRASLYEQADYIIRAFAMAIAAGVQKISVYKLVDGDISQRMPWGMVRNDGTLRPEYVAYQVAASHFANPGNVTYTNSNGVDVIEMNRGSSRTWVLVNTAPGATTATVPYLSSEATVTTPLGVSSAIAAPPFTLGQLPQATIDLPGATNGIIGGAPMIVDESNISDVLNLSPEAVYFTRAGHVVANGILDYWRTHGGLSTLGPPTSDEVQHSDRSVQSFGKAVLEAFPAFKGTSFYVQVGTGKASPTDPTKSVAGPGISFFKITGHNVGFAFLKAFTALGGVSVLGYPRTEAMTLNGKTVQFFQRGVMEYHPEAAGTPNEVQLQFVGSQLTKGQNFPTSAPTPNDSQHQYFPQTHHTVAFAFLQEFQANGGVSFFGYPISDAYVDASGHTVQYFQRARMEYHPELASKPGQVQLGLVGDELLHSMGWQ